MSATQSRPPAEVLADAFHAHKAGQTKFTRRMAITIGDYFGMTPWEVVKHYERVGLLKRGSVAWFAHNGGFSKENFAEVRADRAAQSETRSAGA